MKKIKMEITVSVPEFFNEKDAQDFLLSSMNVIDSGLMTLNTGEKYNDGRKILNTECTKQLLSENERMYLGHYV